MGHFARCKKVWGTAPFWVLVFLVLGCTRCASMVSDKARQSARISYDLGVASLNQGEHREALRVLLTAVQEDPGLAEAHNALGLVLHAMGKPVDALVHYRKAVALRDKFSEAQNNMGIVLLDMGRYDDAIASFELALANILYSTPYLAEGNMGWAYYKKGDVVAAEEHIGNAVATDPQFCRGYEWLARIALEQNKPAAAISHGQRFKRYCLDNANVAAGIAADYRREMKYYLAMGYLKQGNRETARTLFAECAVRDKEAVGFAAKCAQSLATLRSAQPPVAPRDAGGS